MRIAFEVIVAALAVFGLYFFIKVITGRIFADKEIGAAVIIDHETQLDNLDILILEASEALFCVQRRKISVSCPKAFGTGTRRVKKRRSYLYAMITVSEYMI